MKAINGNLPINTKYKIIDLVVGDDYNFTTCENCGNIIKNIAVVESELGKHYQIGLDCASALTSKECNYSISDLQVMQAKKTMRKKINFIKELKEAKTVVINIPTDTLWYYRNEVNEWKSFFRGRARYSDFKQYIPETKIIFENN